VQSRPDSSSWCKSLELISQVGLCLQQTVHWRDRVGVRVLRPCRPACSWRVCFRHYLMQNRNKTRTTTTAATLCYLSCRPSTHARTSYLSCSSYNRPSSRALQAVVVARCFLGGGTLYIQIDEEAKCAGPLGNYHGQLLFQYLGRQRGNIYFLSLDSQFIKYSTVIG